MAHYLIFPQKDTFVSNARNFLNDNFGIDAVLEVEKIYRTDLADTYYTRALVKFDLAEISQSIVDSSITNPTFTLNLKVVEANEIPLDYTIECFPISQSWDMGRGRKFDHITEGASWKSRSVGMDSGSFWTYSTTASFTDTSGGGTWYTSSASSSQSFSYEVSDIRMDVTSIVNNWLSGSIPNEGFILKHTDSAEQDKKNYGKLRFYSKDTNTVYSPYLDISWDDSSFNTGSLSPVSSSVSKVVYVSNLSAEYKAGSNIRLNVFSREKYPTKTYNRTSDYLIVRYLPSTTYYAIKDAESEEVIVDFDDFTKVSCDSTGNYFNLNTNGLAQERYFKIILKVIQNGRVEYFDNNSPFKITR